MITTLGVLLTGLYATGECQELTATGTRLTRCTPSTITPGMWIKVEGYRIGGFESISKVKLLFVQDGNSFAGSPNSGSRESIADSQVYLESLSLAVPRDLKPGKCEITIETDSVPCTPLEVEITDKVLPVVISNHRSGVVQPGDHVWMTAMGICESDEIELIDSEGQPHLVTPFRTSEGTGASFEVPDGVAAGAATFRVVEKRSGLNHHSNSLPLRIDLDPGPLVIYLPSYRGNSLAPGQWIDAALQNSVLAERAELIEVAFTQNEQVIVPVQPFKRSTNSRLHVQVPTSLLPGPVKIATRTWMKGRASSWGEPLEIELLERPAAPRLWGIYHSKSKGTTQSFDFTSPGAQVITSHVGDTLVISGMFMVESVSRLRLTLAGSDQDCDLPLIETGDQARLSFTIPATPKPGKWQLVVTNLDDDVSATLPITVVIE